MMMLLKAIASDAILDSARTSTGCTVGGEKDELTVGGEELIEVRVQRWERRRWRPGVEASGSGQWVKVVLPSGLAPAASVAGASLHWGRRDRRQIFTEATLRTCRHCHMKSTVNQKRAARCKIHPGCCGKHETCVACIKSYPHQSHDLTCLVPG